MREIDVINERLEKGDQQFTELKTAMLGIKEHLGRQDETMACLTTKIDKVVQGTEDVVTMWNGGVKAVRFFCRMAEAWRFLMRQVLYPFGFLIALIYGLWYFHQHGSLPEWAITAFKFFNGVL